MLEEFEEDTADYDFDLDPQFYTVKVVNSGSYNLNNFPFFIDIENFNHGVVDFQFFNSTCIDIRYGENRPWSENRLQKLEEPLQYRHIIGVQWIKDTIQALVKDKNIEELINTIKEVRTSLLPVLKITSWPIFPDASLMTKDDYLVLLIYYEYEIELIQAKADLIELTAVQQLALLCCGFDDFCNRTFASMPELGQQKYFARGIARLYRDMIYNQHNIFVGPRDVNARLGELTALLKNQMNTKVFPLNIPLWSGTKFRNIRDYFFYDKDAKKEQTITVDSKEMLHDLYFAAQYDREIEISPRTSNAVRLFFHAYGGKQILDKTKMDEEEVDVVMQV